MFFERTIATGRNTGNDEDKAWKKGTKNDLQQPKHKQNPVPELVHHRRLWCWWPRVPSCSATTADIPFAAAVLPPPSDWILNMRFSGSLALEWSLCWEHPIGGGRWEACVPLGLLSFLQVGLPLPFCKACMMGREGVRCMETNQPIKT